MTDRPTAGNSVPPGPYRNDKPGTLCGPIPGLDSYVTVRDMAALQARIDTLQGEVQALKDILIGALRPNELKHTRISC
jgi:hypothetical protein